jgi:uncharacterized protein (DUF362 family)
LYNLDPCVQYLFKNILVADMSKSKGSGQFSRREFLQLLSTIGGAAALSSFLQACSQSQVDLTSVLTPVNSSTMPPPTGTSTATETATQAATETAEPAANQTEQPLESQVEDSAQVGLIKTGDRSQGVRRAIELFGLNNLSGKSVFIKPNFNSPDPAPGSTHPDVLRMIISILFENGASRITVGDRSGMGDTRKTMEKIGVFQMAEEMGFDCLVFDEMPAEDWIMLQPPISSWKLGFPFARPCLETDVLIQACCLKTHRFGGHFTMSLKNSVGMVAKYNLVDNYNFMDELHSSPHQRQMIAEINTAYSPDLIILDGVEAFITGGPDNGKRIKSDVILAGTDRIAIDAVGVALLRYHGCQTEVAKGKIFQQEQLERAVQLDLGVDSPKKIEFLTEDPESAAYADLIKKILIA